MGQCRSLDLKDVIVDQPLRNKSFGRVDAPHRTSFQYVAKGRGEHFEVAVTVGEATRQLLCTTDPSNFKSTMLSRSTISQKGFRKKKSEDRRKRPSGFRQEPVRVRNHRRTSAGLQ